MIKSWAVIAFTLSLIVPAAGQRPGREGVETDPIRCWWKTSVPAVRVGEPFSVVLTCAVVETNAVTVVPSQAELNPDALQLPPFDVIGGSHGADLRTADRRFFQYEYRLRLISEELFGKDVKVPDLKISYKVRTRVNGESQEGRDLAYILPATSILAAVGGVVLAFWNSVAGAVAKVVRFVLRRPAPAPTGEDARPSPEPAGAGGRD